jgi:KipI family sensor histidine kinase inhibitor
VPRIETASDDTLRVPIRSRSKRASLAQHLRESGRWRECVEGMREIVVQYDSATLDRVGAKAILAEQLTFAPRPKHERAPLIRIPVCYGGEFGPELASVAEMLDVDEQAVIDMHTGHHYVVELIGFTPGFAYVSGLHDDLKVPRLSEPRQHVAAGSVGIAGGLTGLYALPGPGGWPLIGRTPLPLFRTTESQPMLLRSGAEIHFVAIDAQTFATMSEQ